MPRKLLRSTPTSTTSGLTRHKTPRLGAPPPAAPVPPPSMGRSTDRLDHPQFPARLFGHALWGPDRLVDDVDARVGDAGQRHQVVAHVRHHVRGHRAAQSGEGHLHVDALGLDRDVINQTEVDDVDRDLRVEALAQDLDHVLRFDGGVGGDLGRDSGLFAHGFSSGRPASFQALVPPRKLTTSLTPSATAISDATAERSPTPHTKIVRSRNFCAAGFARMELNTTCDAPGRWPLFHSQSSRTSTTS